MMKNFRVGHNMLRTERRDKGKKFRTVSHLAKSGSPVLYIIFIYNLYTSLYKVCARACPSSSLSWGFFRRYSGQVGRGSGRTGQAIALSYKGARYSGIPWQRLSPSDEKNGVRPKIYTYTHYTHIENKNISRPPPPPMVYI